LVVALAVALGMALIAVVILALVLPRRVTRLVLAESARQERHAHIAQVALFAASATEVAEIVAPLRVLLDEQSRQVFATREHTAASVAAEVERATWALRGLVEWLALFANAHYAQVVAATQAAPETTRQPDRAPVSRPRASPFMPAVAPPGAAAALPPEPAQRAAGLLRPRASGPPQSETAPIGSGERRRATAVGLAPPEGRPPGYARTLLSMRAVRSPELRDGPSSTIAKEDENPDSGSTA
jgi:hypothetical protein